MSRKSLLINRPFLISLVRDRPAIWDKTMKSYKCKRSKTEAWREICLVLNKDYERMDQNKRKEYFKQLIRMWTHIRDSWMKSMKHKRNEKELTKPYIYHDQLLFLKKVFKPSEVFVTVANTEDIEQDEAIEEEKELESVGNSCFSMEVQEIFEEGNQREMTKKTLIINRSQLINLVRERPAIWDKTLDIYKNKVAKVEAWRDICLIMNEYYEQMNQSKRKEYFRLLMSIWTQIRDTWMRSVKNKYSRPYKHHEKMLFLKKIISSNEVLENIENTGDVEQYEDIINEEHERESIDTNCSSMKKQKIAENDHEFAYFVDPQVKHTCSQTETEDRNYSFFKSIQPTLAFFNDDQILQFQAGTISLLQKIKMGQNYNEFQPRFNSPVRFSGMSEEVSPSLIQDPIKIETYDIT